MHTIVDAHPIAGVIAVHPKAAFASPPHASLALLSPRGKLTRNPWTPISTAGNAYPKSAEIQFPAAI